MPGLILDSGAVTYFAGASSEHARAMLAVINSEYQWPIVVPSTVLVECLTGHPQKDARTNRFLKGCVVATVLSQVTARRAATLRRMAGRGSAVDAALVALAEPHGVIFSGDTDDLTKLASNAANVSIESI